MLDLHLVTVTQAHQQPLGQQRIAGKRFQFGEQFRAVQFAGAAQSLPRAVPQGIARWRRRRRDAARRSLIGADATVRFIQSWASSSISRSTGQSPMRPRIRIMLSLQSYAFILT